MRNDSKEEYIKDTENLILEAAEREFMDKGFAGARTTTIAEKAGVTHAMLHYYFRTKEKLFDRIISDKVSLLKENLVRSVKDIELPLNEMLRRIIDSHMEFISSNPELPRFIIGELFSGTERAQTILNKIKEHAPIVISILQNKIDEGVAIGEIRHVDAGMLVLDIASLNIFSYLATPVVNAVLGDCMEDSRKFLEMRKKENYDTIIRKLIKI